MPDLKYVFEILALQMFYEVKINSTTLMRIKETMCVYVPSNQGFRLKQFLFLFWSRRCFKFLILSNKKPKSLKRSYDDLKTNRINGQLSK